MKPYLELLRHILDHGVTKGDRTGTGIQSVFGTQLRFDLAEGFPLVTTRKVFFKGVIHELLWFLAGDTNIQYLKDHNVHIYLNQIEGVREQLQREPRPLPRLVIQRKPASLFEYRFEDFELVDYHPHPAIKYPVAV